MRVISESIAEKFDFGKTAATAFILTGRDPDRLPINGKIRGFRIVMDADSSVSNKDFTEVFKSLKKRIPGKRGKPLEEKVLTIVGFFGSKLNPKESWEKRCDLWNEKNFPEDTGGWYYDDAKQLSKDYQEGLRNLIPSFDFETSKRKRSKARGSVSSTYPNNDEKIAKLKADLKNYFGYR